MKCKLIIGFYSSSCAQFENFKKDFLEKNATCSINAYVFEILWFNSKNKSRLYYINKHINEWILFLDHDCQIDKENLSWLRSKINSSSEDNLIFAGSYVNTAASSYLQKAHNYIANCWLRKKQNRILGGAFLIYSKMHFSDSVVEENLFWGGEDAHLARTLLDKGFCFFQPLDFKVIHLTNMSFKHFVKRAFLHGLHYCMDLDHTGHRKLTTNYLAVDSVNLWPAVLLHFFCFGLGGITGKFLRLRRLGSSTVFQPNLER